MLQQLKDFQKKYLRLWATGCTVQQIFMVLQIISIIFHLFAIALLWTAMGDSPSDTPQDAVLKALYRQFRVRLTIYLVCIMAVNFLAQTILLNLFCRSSYNTNTAMSNLGYFLLFLFGFALVGGIISLIFSPILLDFKGKLNDIENPQHDATFGSGFQTSSPSGITDPNLGELYCGNCAERADEGGAKGNAHWMLNGQWSSDCTTDERCPPRR